MGSLNRATVLGNVTRDIEIKYAGNGNAIANFSVATNETWTDKATGTKQEKAEFHRVTVFGKLAELCAEYLKKGSQVYLDGRLQTREYEAKDGAKKSTTEIIAQNVVFVGGGKGGGSGPAAATDDPF